jgi:hypothetical protein
VALVRTDVSEELSGSIIRVTRIGELGTPLVTDLTYRYMSAKRITLKIMALFLYSCDKFAGAEIEE